MAGRLLLNYWASRIGQTGRAADYLVFTVQAIPAFCQRAYYVSGNKVGWYIFLLPDYLSNTNTQG